MNTRILNLVLAASVILAFGTAYAGKDDSKSPAGGARAIPMSGSNIGTGINRPVLERVICGNGILEGTEQCDDGNNVNDDGCSCSCFLEPVPRVPNCGNGICEVGEGEVIVNGVLDKGYPTTCLRDCQDHLTRAPTYYVQCGNCMIDARGEECDDGNRLGGDGCSSSCMQESGPMFVCGNGFLESGEECDDGNNVDGDGCSRVCASELRPPDVPPPAGGPSPSDGPIPGSPSLSCQERLRLFIEINVECAPLDSGCIERCDCRCEDFPPECDSFGWLMALSGEFHPSIGRTKAGGNGVAVDSENNVYVVGSTYKGLDCPTSEGFNIDLYKFDRCGTYLWHRVVNGYPQWRGNGHDYGLGLAVDPFDNAYITGRVQKQAAATGDGIGRMIIQKYFSNGRLLSTYYSENPGATEGRAIALNAQGKIFVTGIERPLTGASSRFWLGKFEFGNLGITLMPVTTPGWPFIRSSSNIRLNAAGAAIPVSQDGNLYALTTNLPTEPPTLLTRETAVMRFRQARGRDLFYGNRGSAVFGGPEGYWIEGKDAMIDDAGNVVITGKRLRQGEIYEKLWIEKLDPAGNSVGGLFPIVASDFFSSVGNGIAKTSDGFVVAGTIIPSRGAASQCLVRKYSPSGEILFSVVLSSQCMFLNDVTVSDTGKIVVTGTSSTGGMFIQKF